MRERPRLLRRLAWYRRRAQALEQQSVIDDLTGLRNQRALWRELDRWGQLCSPSHPLAVLMFDFDRLSEVNATFGRAVGDAVLRRGATALCSAATSPRVAFRYGGEEFVLIAEADEQQATELAERVRAYISSQNGSLPAVTVSCGVAEFAGPFEPWVALDRADAALRDAKRSGGDRLVVAGRTSPGERLMLVEELEHETARRAAMALAVATLQVRDSGIADHSDDVLTLCEAVGRRLGFGEREIQQLMAGAQLHDVGKVAMPTSILNKPSPLTDDEWAVIREHTIIGERILSAVPEMEEIATIVRHSHEHWDGSGYPDGLAGEEIPRASRVILCADAFHAMRADRPYRRGRPARAVVAELQECRGTQFEPAVVDAFVDVVDAARRTRPIAVDARKRRLIALLTAFVIGGGSAIAGNSELRDAIKSVFGTSVPSSEAALDSPAPLDFGLGPLGETLRLDGRAQRERRPAKNETTAKKRDRAASDAAERISDLKHIDNRRHPGGGGGESVLKGIGPASSPQRATPLATAQPVPENGSGRALGRGAPTPRPPAVPPGHAPGASEGRTDPPALGLENGPNNKKR